MLCSFCMTLLQDKRLDGASDVGVDVRLESSDGRLEISCIINSAEEKVGFYYSQSSKNCARLMITLEKYAHCCSLIVLHGQ